MLNRANVAKPKDVIDGLRANLIHLNTDNRKLRSFAGLPVMTHAFFPGGNGLYEGIYATDIPIGGTLILGSNFGCVSRFIDGQGKLLVLDERDNRTWTPLLEILDGSGIRRQECFFTNAWPFLHVGEGNLGPVGKWLKDSELMASSIRFFGYTLATMQPSLIVALGAGPGAFLSHVWPKDLSPWRVYTIKGLDALPMATVGFGEQRGVCVAITHPSMPNAWRRRPPYQHRDGEIRLLSIARAKSAAFKKDSCG